MFRSLLRPGQGFQPFSVLSRQGSVSENGRPQIEQFVPAGRINGMLCLASQGELLQWRGQEKRKQDSHAVFYKIIQNGAGIGVKPTDVLVLGERRFTVKGIHNPAGLNHFTVYFAEEREDLQ